jgi:hypothetical protein
MVGLAISFLGNLVRSARFERAAYGFEDRTSEFPNRLKLHRHIEPIIAEQFEKQSEQPWSDLFNAVIR